MCGITGALSVDGREVDAAPLGPMMDSLVHRGPDDAGSWRSEQAALGFRRLSFLDLAGGNQPLFSEARDIVLVCNGEIFNYRDLRTELVAKGHRFRTRTDVEVIVHLYEEAGDGLLGRIEGQFAFALLDLRRRRALLARDHFGICPLYWTVTDGVLVFASEIKALLHYPGVRRSVDLVALDQILTFPGVVSPRTIFAGIASLPPGHFLTLECGSPAVRQYWDLDFPLAGDYVDRGEDDWVEDLGSALTEAVSQRLHADVPIGYYLSGGLDSAILATLIRAGAAGAATPAHSFSIQFEDRAYDESRFQSLVAPSGPTRHDVLMGPSQTSALLRRAVLHAEAPLKESYNTASLLLSEAARTAGIPGILSGEGADELFAGYVGHRFDKMRHARPAPEQPDGAEDEARMRLWGDTSLFYEKNYARHAEERRALYSADLAAGHGEFDCTREPVVDPAKLKGRAPLSQRCYLDYRLRLADHLVADHGDRMALANSVEARYPFLDLRVAALATSMSPDLKLRGYTEKYVLRSLARRLGVPPAIADREKFHFVAPSSDALIRSGDEWVRHALSPATIERQGYFDPLAVSRLVERSAQPGFALDLPFEDDPLMVVLTFGALIEEFGLATRG